AIVRKGIAAALHQVVVGVEDIRRGCTWVAHRQMYALRKRCRGSRSDNCKRPDVICEKRISVWRGVVGVLVMDGSFYDSDRTLLAKLKINVRRDCKCF